MAPFSALQVANSGFITGRPQVQQKRTEPLNQALPSALKYILYVISFPSLPLANYLHNKIFPDFARFSLLFLRFML